jgi:hypothetical protein
MSRLLLGSFWHLGTRGEQGCVQSLAGPRSVSLVSCRYPAARQAADSRPASTLWAQTASATGRLAAHSSWASGPLDNDPSTQAALQDDYAQSSSAYASARASTGQERRSWRNRATGDRAERAPATRNTDAVDAEDSRLAYAAYAHALEDSPARGAAESARLRMQADVRRQRATRGNAADRFDDFDMADRDTEALVVTLPAPPSQMPRRSSRFATSGEEDDGPGLLDHDPGTARDAARSRLAGDIARQRSARYSLRGRGAEDRQALEEARAVLRADLEPPPPAAQPSTSHTEPASANDVGRSPHSAAAPPATALPTRHVVAAVDPDLGGALAIIYWDEESAPEASGSGEAGQGSGRRPIPLWPQNADGGGRAWRPPFKCGRCGCGACGCALTMPVLRSRPSWLDPDADAGSTASAAGAAPSSPTAEAGSRGPPPRPPANRSAWRVAVWDMPVSWAERKTLTPSGKPVRRRCVGGAAGAEWKSRAGTKGRAGCTGGPRQ